jgi:hypothetical protein
MKVEIDPVTKQPTKQSTDCMPNEICVNAVYDVGDTAMICAPPEALCAPIEADCAAKGKVCAVIMGSPTCTFATPTPGPCESFTCPANTTCQVNAMNQPFCDSNNGFPNGAACSADTQCQSTKCANSKCVAVCAADSDCATTEWCDIDGSKTCKPDLTDGQTVCKRNAMCAHSNCEITSGTCKPAMSSTCSTDSGCPDTQWCDTKSATCKDDLTPPNGTCERNAQCTTSFCAPNGTCQMTPPAGNCASHTLKIPAEFSKDFGASTGPAQGTVRSVLAISGTKGTATGRTLNAPGGSWITIRKVGDTISFCPDSENLLLNGSGGGNYVVGGYRNGTVCEANVDAVLLAAIKANITTATGVAVDYSILCDTECGCSLYVFRK